MGVNPLIGVKRGNSGHIYRAIPGAEFCLRCSSADCHVFLAPGAQVFAHGYFTLSLYPQLRKAREQFVNAGCRKITGTPPQMR